MNECTFDMQIPCVSGCPLYVRYPDPQCILQLQDTHCHILHLAIQATSCANERTFSTGSNTVTCRRTKLDPENVHMIVFCKDNLKPMKFKLAGSIHQSEEGEKEEQACEAEEVQLALD